MKAHYFRIGIVEKYFSKKDRPVELMNKESKIAEISRRRNIIESMLRKHILQIGTLSFSKRDRREKILSKLTCERRQELSHLELDRIYLSDNNPLLFSELKNTICGLWDVFQNSIEMQKSEFEYHMNTINKFRIDAHAKGISPDDFNKTRVSLTSIENCLPPQF